jgi:hypothetical protein
MFARLRNLTDLSIDEMVLIEEALAEKIIREDRSTLPGHVKVNRDRLMLRTRLSAAKWRKQALAQDSMFTEAVASEVPEGFENPYEEAAS